MKKKILYIINDLGIGGAQRLLYDLLRELDKTHFEPYIINLNFDRSKILEKEIILLGVPVFNFRSWHIGDFRSIWYIYKIIKKYHFDIVHTHLCLASLFGTLAAKTAGVKKIISSEHNTTTFKSRNLYKIAAHIFLNLNTKSIAISKAVKESIYEMSPYLSKKVQVIYNGIDTKTFDSKIHNITSTAYSHQFSIGTLVRNDPRKGFGLFIECASQLKAMQPDLRFCAAASDNFNVPNSCIDFVSLDGTSKSVARYLASLDVFLLPSLEEGLGLVAIEAMALGIPVIASNVGGLKEVITHNENGLLVNPGDVNGFIKAVLWIKHNQGHAQSLASRGQQKVTRIFTLDRMAKEIQNLYLGL